MLDLLESLSEEQRALFKQVDMNQLEVIQAKLEVEGDQDEGQLDEGVVVDLLESVARVINVSSVRTAFRRWRGAARQATALRQELRRARKRWWSLAFRQWRNVVDNTMVTQAERRAD